ncbi:MAG: transposase family protein, partial [Gammaproteobacteria bacterium]|nr:transposase family protein [Gammaproteobacteria bacterium]
DITSSTIAKVLVESIICRYSAPRQILSDRGPNFMSQLMKDVYHICNVRKVNTTPYHPQCDGLTENFNGTLTKTLAKYGTANQDWPALLPFALFAYRTSMHSSTQETPYFAMFGHDPRLPIDSVLLQPYRFHENLEYYPHKIAAHMKEVWHDIQIRISQSQAKQKHHYDKKVTKHTYTVGQRVWLKR